MSELHTHWEWSNVPAGSASGDGVPEDAALMGPTAIATFSGRVFDATNQGVEGLLPPGIPMAELWVHAGLRFRIGVIVSGTGLLVAMIFVWLFIGQPRWQFATAMGIATVVFVVGVVQAVAAMQTHQRQIAALDAHVPAPHPGDS